MESVTTGTARGSPQRKVPVMHESTGNTPPISSGLCEGSVANNHIKREKQEVEKLNQELPGRPKRTGIPKFKFKMAFCVTNQRLVGTLIM